MREALFYTNTNDEIVKCLLCPHECIIPTGKNGICRVRVNKGGKLYSTVYGQLVATHIDPIEKKPLYHFFPGSKILSIGTIGCNFHCSFCQNHAISQCSSASGDVSLQYTPDEIAAQAKIFPENIGIAYTYNEPIIFYEYLLETAKNIHSLGLKNAMVSNGFIMPEPLKELIPYIDAFNIDLKAFNNDFYRKFAKGKLDPVLHTLEQIVNAGKHLEITYLVITDENDNEEEFERMTKWIATKLGKNIPLHISRYYPVYKMNNPATPISTLEKFYEIATENLHFTYLGNVFDEERSSTYCPKCKSLLIRRNRYSTKFIGLSNENFCSKCYTSIKVVN